LFDTGASNGHPISLGREPRQPFMVEIALYAPGSRPCEDDQPLVGLGRSRVVDPRRDGGTVTVPLGCRSACSLHSDVKAQLLSLEDLTTDVGTPPDLALGEIYPYEALTATAGVCRTPPSTAYHGVFRPFALSRMGASLAGEWTSSSGEIDGCTALAGTSNGGRQYSCLLHEYTSKTTVRGFVLDAEHLRVVQALNASVHAKVGALVIRVVDWRDGDGNGSAIGARVTYAAPWSLGGTAYPIDENWQNAVPTPDGTSADGLGVAVIVDAEAGPYLISFSDGSMRVVNAGGADDPRSVTALVVTPLP
jgi:hypothetical protein